MYVESKTYLNLKEVTKVQKSFQSTLLTILLKSHASM
jgi:hypothetical protein